MVEIVLRLSTSQHGENSMLLAGLKLMLIGMATVLLFLLLMIALIQLVSKLAANITASELEDLESEKRERRRAHRTEAVPPHVEGDIPIAVFAAAIAAYENDVGKC